MFFEFFIARRLRSNTRSTSSIVGRVALCAVTLSIAVLVITSAVLFGFREQLIERMSVLSGEVVLTDVGTFRFSNDAHVAVDKDILEIGKRVDGVRDVSMYVTTGGVLQSHEGSCVCHLQGLNASKLVPRLTDKLLCGTLPSEEFSSGREIVISSTTARRLGVGVNDIVEFFSKSPKNQFIRTLFRVSAIVDVSISVDFEQAFTTLTNAQRVADLLPQRISGYMIDCDGDYLSVASDINGFLVYDYQGTDNLSAFTFDQLYGNLFAWLSTLDINSRVIIIIMMAVSLFNMIVALLVLILEKTRTIGVLRSLGLSRGRVRRIFVIESGEIIVKGIILGDVCGLVLCALQKWFHILRLDASAYLLSEVPIKIDVLWIIVTNVIFVVLLLAVVMMATTIISKITPSTTLKYE
ncbi:MAG: ABC transporter permease [Alistipes sp.]|nr:ABC transporter permease [Candidatus Alistipes equi]